MIKKLKKPISVLVSLMVFFSMTPINTLALLLDTDSEISDSNGEVFDNASISKAIIDADGNATVNGDYVLIVNNSKTANESTGSISSLLDFQTTDKSGDIYDAGSYPIDYHPELGSVLSEEIEKYRKSNLEVQEKASYSVGTTKVFKVNPNLLSSSDTYSNFNAKALAVGEHCVVWAHDSVNGASDSFNTVYNNSVTTTVANLIQAEFDKNYSAMVTNFGNYMDTDASGKVSILVYNLPDGWSGSGGYIAGYFSAADLVDFYSNSSGNNMPLIHIDTYPAMGTNYSNYNPSLTYSTLVHEFQHMINYSIGYSQNRNFPYFSQNTFINEMCSMAAEDMFYDGIKESRLGVYNSSTYGQYIASGHSLTQWDSSNPLPNYSLSYLFGQYLVAQTGNYKIFSNIVNSQYYDETAITSSLSSATSLLKGLTFNQIHMNFRTALTFNESTGINSFKGSSVLTSDTINKNLYKGSSPATLKPGASILLYNPNKTITLSTSGMGSDIAYYGISAGAPLQNVAPVASDSTINVIKNSSISSKVSATDLNNDTLTYTLVTNTTHGTLVLNSNGNYTYTPNADYMGTDSFTYKANDGKLDSNIATVTINVVEVTLSLDKNFISVVPGETASITAKSLYGNTNKVTWTIVGNDNNQYASIAVSGNTIKVTGKAAGNFTATATSVDDPNKKVTANIEVIGSEEVTCRSLAIGMGQYSSSPLAPAPENDAFTFSQILAQSTLGFSDNNLNIKCDTEADTKAELSAAILAAFGKSDENDINYFYYSGHGAVGGYLYLPGGAVSPAELSAMFNTVKGKIVIVADCCFSGGLINKATVDNELQQEQFADNFISGFTSTDSKIISKATTQNTRFKILCASSKLETSQQITDHGFFTSALALGCGVDYALNSDYKECAADSDRDNAVSLSEIYHFIDNTNLSSSTKVFPENDSFSFITYGDDKSVPNTVISNAYALTKNTATIKADVEQSSNITVQLYSRYNDKTDCSGTALFNPYNTGTTLKGYIGQTVYSNVSGKQDLSYTLPSGFYQ